MRILFLLISFFTFSQTPCLDAVANATGLLGEFIPQCEEDGSYSPLHLIGINYIAGVLTVKTNLN